jgi:hypothetical protein
MQRTSSLLLGLALWAGMTMAMEIESFWEYSDPAGSEARFRAALATAHGDDRLEILTQIARTHSLRKRFEEAHRQLDEIEPQLAAQGRACEFATCSSADGRSTRPATRARRERCSPRRGSKDAPPESTGCSRCGAHGCHHARRHCGRHGPGTSAALRLPVDRATPRRAR